MLKEIPKLVEVAGWKEVPVTECGEPLVLLNELRIPKLIVEPAYYIAGVKGSIPELYVRKSVADMLWKATFLIPGNYSLLVWDTWRPLQVQGSLFDQYKEEFRKQKPELSEEELIRYTQTFVSLPSDLFERPSPHYTGGSVDLTLALDGTPINMGTEFDEFTEKANTRYFEENGCVTESDLLARDNRRMLFEIMTEVGFTNYHEEWWHFDYGNQFWAKCASKEAAIYSGAFPSDQTSRKGA